MEGNSNERLLGTNSDATTNNNQDDIVGQQDEELAIGGKSYTNLDDVEEERNRDDSAPVTPSLLYDNIDIVKSDTNDKETTIPFVAQQSPPYQPRRGKDPPATRFSYEPLVDRITSDATTVASAAVDPTTIIPIKNNDINTTTTNNIQTSGIGMEPPRLPSGEIVDAKNTVRANTIIATTVHTTATATTTNDGVNTDNINNLAHNDNSRIGPRGSDKSGRRHLPTLPSGEIVNAKNTVRANTIIAATVNNTTAPRAQGYDGIDINNYYNNRVGRRGKNDNRRGIIKTNPDHHHHHHHRMTVSSSLPMTSTSTETNSNRNVQDSLQQQQHDVMVEARYIEVVSTTVPNAAFNAGTTSNSATPVASTNTTTRCNRTHVFLAVIMVSMVAGVVGFLVCGGDGCSIATTTSRPSPTTTTATMTSPIVPLDAAAASSPSPPTLPQDRTEQVVSFINSITLSGRTIASPVGLETGTASNSPIEEQSLAWIINDDPLQLVPDTPEHQLQLIQRYALRTIIVQQPVPNEWSDTSTWLLSECEWHGIGCGYGDQPTVITIDFNYESWQGILSPEIGLVSSLMHLDMNNNSFTGSLPSSIGNWQSLRYVDFNGNQLTGSLPTTIGSWQSVTLVDFISNQLTGSLPASIGNWQKVPIVGFADNLFTGTFPNTIAINWTHLDYVWLHINKFTGTVPINWCQLTGLSKVTADCISEVRCSCCECY